VHSLYSSDLSQKMSKFDSLFGCFVDGLRRIYSSAGSRSL
jgi:hypothetical protein